MHQSPNQSLVKSNATGKSPWIHKSAWGATRKPIKSSFSVERTPKTFDTKHFYTAYKPSIVSDNSIESQFVMDQLKKIVILVKPLIFKDWAIHYEPKFPFKSRNRSGLNARIIQKITNSLVRLLTFSYDFDINNEKQRVEVYRDLYFLNDIIHYDCSYIIRTFFVEKDIHPLDINNNYNEPMKLLMKFL